MIQAIFKRSRGVFTGVSVSGHAGYVEEGPDIVCAAVTSAVQLVSNGITEVLKAPIDVNAGEENIDLILRHDTPAGARMFIEALHLHLDILSRQYGGYIEITVREE